MKSELSFFITCIYLTGSINSVVVHTGYFRVLKRNDKIKYCPGNILGKFVGYRVDVTGKCEQLQKSWLTNETVEPGYGYAKTEIIDVVYDKPLVSFSGMNKERLSIPVVLRNDTIIVVFLSNPAIRNEKPTTPLKIGLTATAQDLIFELFTGRSGRTFKIYEYNSDDATSNMIPEIVMPSVLFRKEIVKVSIVCQTKSTKLTVNDKEIWTLPLLYTDLRDYTTFLMEDGFTDKDTNHLSIHRIRIHYN